MDLDQVAVGFSEKSFVGDSLGKQAERMEVEDYAVHLRKVEEDGHCSLESLGHLAGHPQNPYV